MRQPLQQVLASIASDRTHGAARLARLAAQELLEHGPNCSAEEVKAFCLGLVRAQPAMAPLSTLANRVLQSGLDSVPVFLDEAEQAVRRIASHAAGLIAEGAAVMTHSYSQTVLDCLLASRGKGIRVIATESWPLGEGIALAGELKKAGITVDLISDNQVPPQASLVLVGADAVTPAGLVNKIGTAPLALTALEHGKPFYAASSTHKLARQPFVEPLFDLTPLHLITAVITEIGVLDPARLPFSESG